MKTMPSSAAVLAEVQALCAQKKLRFTRARREVLTMLLKARAPCKAYAMLDALDSGGAQPTAVYRALDFLLAHGFAHKIHSQNAYIACRHPQRAHDCYFLICRRCGSARECCDLPARQVIDEAVRQQKYRQPQVFLEIFADCRQCARR